MRGLKEICIVKQQQRKSHELDFLERHLRIDRSLRPTGCPAQAIIFWDYYAS